MGEAEGRQTVSLRSFSKSTAEGRRPDLGQRPGQREEGAGARAILEKEVGHRRGGRSPRFSA